MRAHSSPKLYKRGSVWWCDWKGRRWSTRCEDRLDAERLVRAAYRETDVSAAGKGIADVAELLFAALERRGRSLATRKQAVQKFGHFVRLWAGRPLESIDYKLLAGYITSRLKDDAARLTVSHELGYLRQGWKLARAQGWVGRAWDELMPERFDRQYVPRTRWLTPAELTAVLESLPEEKRAVVAWIVATGSDVGDLSRAVDGDIDWKRNLVRVRGTKTVFRDRYVPITPLTRALLKLAEPFGPPFIAWPWIGGALRKLAVRLGIPHFSPKDLRRTHGQWLRSAGVAPHLIGRVLGHADSAMADRVYAQGDEVAVARLVRMAVGRRTDAVRKPREDGRRTGRTGRKSARK